MIGLCYVTDDSIELPNIVLFEGDLIHHVRSWVALYVVCSLPAYLHSFSTVVG